MLMRMSLTTRKDYQRGMARVKEVAHSSHIKDLIDSRMSMGIKSAMHRVITSTSSIVMLVERLNLTFKLSRMNRQKRMVDIEISKVVFLVMTPLTMDISIITTHLNNMEGEKQLLKSKDKKQMPI